MPFVYLDSDDNADLPMIFRAIERGDLGTVQQILVETPDAVHEMLDTGDQPLHIACWQKYESIVKHLISAGADVNQPGDLGTTPLHYAVFEGDEYSLPIVKALLAAGADPTKVDKRSNSTPLKWAQREHHEGLDDSIKLLKQYLDRAT